MSDLSELSIKNFFIFNESYGNTEGEGRFIHVAPTQPSIKTALSYSLSTVYCSHLYEARKILYYFPPKVAEDEKMKNVGLSEAIIKFTETFNNKQTCQTLHTKKTRLYFYNPEPHYFMVMTVNVPWQQSAEGRNYHGEQVQDGVCAAVLRQAYLAYRLFNNTFAGRVAAADGEPAPLRQMLEPFFNKYLSSLKINHCDIMDIFQGVQFLPLDKQTFLHIQCFINLLEASFPVVEFTAFLYNDRLIWSGLEPEDMQVVFHYLVYSLLPKHCEAEQSTEVPPLSTALASYGKFLTGPENVHSSSNSVGKVPKLFLNYAKPHPATYHAVVYRSNCCTVCLFIPEREQLTMEQFRRWDTFLGPQLSRLGAEVAAHVGRHRPAANGPTPADGAARFVYFNRMNLATKSTMHEGRRSGVTAVAPHVLCVLADINAEHARNESINPFAETIVKTTTDYWVIGRLSNAREFYIVIQHKNANLIEISDEVKRICENELKSIFFHV